MKFDIPNELKDANGVYRIFNTIDGKFYIGSAENLYSRYKIHLKFLRRRKHHTRYLQRAVNKHGIENFSFQLVELFGEINSKKDRDILFDIEQIYLDKTKCYHRKIGYNASKKVYSIMWGRKHGKKALYKLGAKKVLVYNLNGDFITICDTTARDALKFNVSNSAIKKCCKCLMNKAGDHIFRFYQKDYPLKIEGYVHPLVGIPRSKEIRIKIRQGNINSGTYTREITSEERYSIGSAMRGKQHTESTKHKMSILKKGIPFTKQHRLNNDRSRQKPVLVTDWLGYPVFHFKSLKAASAHFKVKPPYVLDAMAKSRPLKHHPELYFTYLPK